MCFKGRSRKVNQVFSIQKDRPVDRVHASWAISWTWKWAGIKEGLEPKSVKKES